MQHWPMVTNAEVQYTLATMEDELSLIEENGEVTQEQVELLYKQIEDLRISNAALLAENGMLERFIRRKDTEDLLSQGEGAVEAGSLKLGGGGVGLRQESSSNTSDRFQPLILEHKLYIAKKEIRETQWERGELQLKTEKTKDIYKASMTEVELRLADTRRAKKDFERRLAKPKKGIPLEMKEPEKVLQYIEDKLKVTQLEKFNIKYRALKRHEKKLLQQLQQKKEQKKAMREAENFFQEYDEPRPDKNLEELKINSLKVQQLLSSHKEKLQSVTLMSAELSNDIAKERQKLAKIEEQIKHAEKERSAAEARNHKLSRQVRDYQAPDIRKYMHVKDKHKKLTQSVHTWERKVRIAEMAFRTRTKMSNKQVGTSSGEHQIPIKLPQIAEHVRQMFPK